MKKVVCGIFDFINEFVFHVLFFSLIYGVFVVSQYMHFGIKLDVTYLHFFIISIITMPFTLLKVLIYDGKLFGFFEDRFNKKELTAE